MKTTPPASKPAVRLIATHYRLPWSRFGNAPEWQRAEIVATSFRGDQPSKWCVREGASALAKNGEWECEPQPSSRDPDFLERTRWDSLEEAAEAARRYFEQDAIPPHGFQGGHSGNGAWCKLCGLPVSEHQS